MASFYCFDAEGRIAGTVSAEAAPDLAEENGVPTGRLGSSGVVPEYRSAELYRALLFVGITYLKTRGKVITNLEAWGEAAATIRSYRQLGFELRSEQIAYTKDLQHCTNVSLD